MALVVAIALTGPGSVSAGQTRYLPFEMFQAWQGLMPEVGEVRLCGLTRAGHALWAQGQLRVPLSPSVVAVGALIPDQELWAGPAGGGGRAGTVRRVARPGAQRPHVAAAGVGAAVLVDTGERRRLTAPATLRWEAGRVIQATPGFVIEVRLIRHVLWWRADDRRLEYERLAVPLEIPDASEEGP